MVGPETAVYGCRSETGISNPYVSVICGCWQICMCGFHFFLNGLSLLG